MPHKRNSGGSLVLSVAPAAEPVSLADAKDHMRVDLGEDDTLITALIVAAKNKIEELTGRKFITQTWIWTFDEFFERGDRRSGDILFLPLAPVSSVTSIVTTDRTGATEIFDLTNVIIDTKTEPSRIALKFGSIWPAPAEQLQEINGVAVTFIVGYGVAGSDVPEPLLLAIKILTAHYYENRDLVAPLDLSKIPMSVLAMIEPFRSWNRFGGASK